MFYLSCSLNFYFLFSVVNPSDNKVLGNVPDMDAEDARQAVEVAHKAFQTWKNTVAKAGVCYYPTLCLKYSDLYYMIISSIILLQTSIIFL